MKTMVPPTLWLCEHQMNPHQRNERHIYLIICHSVPGVDIASEGKAQPNHMLELRRRKSM